MTDDPDWMMAHRDVVLVLTLIHHDKAGETSSVHRVDAQIADVDSNRRALLVTQDGLPVNVPAEALHPVASPNGGEWSGTYVAGHELTRIFHPTADEPRAVPRWLAREEVETLLKTELA